MNFSGRKYPAKLLLFGEHTVLRGSDALAVPYQRYYMKWIPKNNGTHPDWLIDFVEFLVEECTDFLHVDRVNNWIKDFSLEANIPIGYGLGSSGALSAAIFDIGKANPDERQLPVLQEQFGRMESFFHGKSSGFDPLVSYFNKPIIKIDGTIKKLEDILSDDSLKIYLLDSGIKRSGKETIARFLKESDSDKNHFNGLIKSTNKVIKSFCEGNESELFRNMEFISSFQFQSMSYMIIDSLMPLWRTGLDTKEYFMKVCGAGGGGYYLVFSKSELQNLGSFILEKVN